MSEGYIHSNFYLNSSLAEQLYHDTAWDLPAVDFHNHIDPRHLAQNKTFADMAEAWLLFDPYKHRAMRICGVPEVGITGETSNWEKFYNWSGVMPYTVGNPLYIWSALELKRVFEIEEPLGEGNAPRVWEKCNERLKERGYGAADIVNKFNVEILCTSDDLLDDLEPHRVATEKRNIRVYPSLRGDSILNFEPSMYGWFHNLEEAYGCEISDLESYQSAIVERLNAFSSAGCRLADHAIDGEFVFCDPRSYMKSRAAQIFKKWKGKEVLSPEENSVLKNYMLAFLSGQYDLRGWVLQLHIGAQRLTSSRLRKLAGSAGGYAAIGRTCDIGGLCRFLDELEKKDRLPRMILYTLNPSDNEILASVTGSYTRDGVWGKIQFGPAWWYNDHFGGIKKQLSVSANYSLISRFIGMTTDSRSVFSFSRHEYFRRILCSQISDWVREGNLPGDRGVLEKLVKDVSYYNSKQWILNE